MNKHLFIFLAAVFITSSCGKPSAVPPTFTPVPIIMTPTQLANIPLATVTPVCISPKPTQRDIDRALSYTNKTLDESNWEKTYAVADTLVSVTWMNNPQGAVVYLEAIIFPCGYEEPDLNKYYSNENWKNIFQNYESYELIDECKTNTGLRLYEFKAQNQGFEYEIKYWVENDTDTRIISTMIVFPLESKLVLDEYSSMLFPNYSICP